MLNNQYFHFNSLSTFESMFDIVHADALGHYRVQNYDGKRYILTLVDDLSRYTSIFLMNTKVDSIIILKNFVCMI